MKNIIKVILILQVLYFSRQATSKNFKDNAIEIFNEIIPKILEINDEIKYKEKTNGNDLVTKTDTGKEIKQDNKNSNKEEKETKTEESKKDNNLDEKKSIFGPLEIELLKEFLISLSRCQTCTKKLFALAIPLFKDLDYTSSDLIDIIKNIVKRKDFAQILDKILYKFTNILTFESWVRLVRVILEKTSGVLPVKIKRNYYIIYFNETHSETILKDDIYKCSKNITQIIEIKLFLDKFEKFIFHIYKLYKFLDNPWSDYIERFAGTSLNSLFQGSSIISLIFKKDLGKISNGDIYFENFLLDSFDAFSKYCFKKFGFKYFIKAIKNFFGPIGLAIDTCSFIYNIGSSLYESYDDIIN